MDDFHLAVLNAGGNDPDQDFPDGIGVPGDKGHAPVNYHAFAACTGGSFLRSVDKCGSRPVLLLIGRNPARAARAMHALKKSGNRVMLAFKEAGMHQISESLHSAKSWSTFRELTTAADGAVATTPELIPFFEAAGAKRTHYIPTPYPWNFPEWDFSKLLKERCGIFVGTREWDVPSRRHLAALLAAKTLSERTGEPVTVMNLDGRKGRAFLENLGFAAGSLKLVEQRLGYADYLRLVARHKLVWQLDRSRVPGQVAGDALLCGIPCVGGDGAVDREVFPVLCGDRLGDIDLIALAIRLLKEPDFYNQTVGQARVLAAERLSFAIAEKNLQACFSPAQV